MPLQPAPVRNRLVDLRLGNLSAAWGRWFQAVQQAINSQAEGLGSVALSAQSASIGTTAVPMPALTAGVYRVSVAVRVTTAAGVSSSIQTTIGWTSGTVAQSQSGAVNAGNTTTTQESYERVIRGDANTTITYSTTYASNPAAAMQYQLDIKVARLP